MGVDQSDSSTRHRKQRMMRTSTHLSGRFRLVCPVIDSITPVTYIYIHHAMNIIAVASRLRVPAWVWNRRVLSWPSVRSTQVRDNGVAAPDTWAGIDQSPLHSGMIAPAQSASNGPPYCPGNRPMIFARTGNHFFTSRLPAHRLCVKRAAQAAGIIARPLLRVIAHAHHTVVAMTGAVSATHTKRTQV